MEGGIVSLVLWVLSLAAAISSVVLGAILSYHWFNFGSNTITPIAALIMYTTGCVLLITILIALAAAV